MTPYILVIALMTNTVESVAMNMHHIEFPNEQSCKNARIEVVKGFKDALAGRHNTVTWCIAKESSSKTVTW